MVVLEHGSCHHPRRSLHGRFRRFSCSCCWAWLSDVSPSLETLGSQTGMRAGKSMGICWQHLLPRKILPWMTTSYVRSCSQGFPSMKTRTTVIFFIIFPSSSKLMQSGDISPIGLRDAISPRKLEWLKQ